MADETTQIGPVILLGTPRGREGNTGAKHCRALCIPQISTGDLLRDHVARGTALGLEAKAIMARGELVPDKLMYGIVADRLRVPHCRRGFVLDGFPRTAAQEQDGSGKCALRPSDPKSRPGLAFGAGMQIATSQFHAYNHELVLTARWIF